MNKRSKAIGIPKNCLNKKVLTVSNPKKKFAIKCSHTVPGKLPAKTADTLMTGMKSELQPKKANRHTVHRKLLLKTNTLLTFGMNFKTAN